MTTTPLSRNRNYQLLWTSQAVAEFGFNATAIAFPLLVLAVTGSAAASGVVLGAIAVAQLVVGLPAGALVDRWNRKKVMLACEAAQALAAASLVGALWLGVVSVAHMVVVAIVIGVCAALFEPAEDASLPNIVPAEQLSTAVAMNSARSSLGQLAGTAAGGFLFAVGRVVPFVVDALTHTMAFLGLAFLRLPPREVRPEPIGHLGREMAAGLRWVWQQRHIRVTALCAVVLNLFFSAFYIVVIVLAAARGVPAGEIGVMAAMLGVGGVVGALAAPYLHRRMSPYVSIAAVFWVLSALTPLAVFVRNGYLLGALLLAMALLPPTANTTIMTQQLLMTSDELRGRLSAVVGLIVGIAAAVGPVLGGFLMEAVAGSQAVLICAGGIAAVTLLVTASPTLRRFPRPPADEEDLPAEDAHPAEGSAAVMSGAPLAGRASAQGTNSTERRQRDG
jgi:MFS family permease